MSVSVCIATYNGEKYIKEQLDSILHQLTDQDEIIISDDSSTDKTIEIIESFNDKRIILFKNQTFFSHVYNFENALKISKGEYIFLADQDDIWVSTKVEKMMNLLKTYDLVLSDAIMVDTNKQVINESFFLFNASRKGFIKNLYKNSYLGCCMAFDRKILNLSLPFPSDINMHDWWIGLIAEIYGNIHFTTDKLVEYRRHEETVTPINRKSTNSLYKKISFRLKMIKGLFLQILTTFLIKKRITK